MKKKAPDSLRDKELRGIISWIVEHSEDMEAIDKINSVTFPFTSKYLGYSQKKQRVLEDEVEENEADKSW